MAWRTGLSMQSNMAVMVSRGIKAKSSIYEVENLGS